MQITQFADNYTAARLLLPELWSKIAAESGGRLYAAAPVRDMIVWTTSAAKADQLALRAHARNAHRSRSYPISPAILRWTARGWTLVDENPDRACDGDRGETLSARRSDSPSTPAGPSWWPSSGPAASAAVIDRRRIEMMPHRDAKRPRFVYHAAQKLPRAAAERLVRESTAMSWKNAKAAIRAAVEELRTTGYDVVANGIIVGNKRLEAALDTILESHALIHTAEGQLFRDAIRRASEALAIPVTEVGAKELEPRAAKAALSDVAGGLAGLDARPSPWSEATAGRPCVAGSPAAARRGAARVRRRPARPDREVGVVPGSHRPDDQVVVEAGQTLLQGVEQLRAHGQSVGDQASLAVRAGEREEHVLHRGPCAGRVDAHPGQILPGDRLVNPARDARDAPFVDRQRSLVLGGRARWILRPSCTHGLNVYATATIASRTADTQPSPVRIARTSDTAAISRRRSRRRCRRGHARRTAIAAIAAPSPCQLATATSRRRRTSPTCSRST